MKGDRRRLYADEQDFYALVGSVAMKLTPQAAVDVCRSASGHGLVIARVEGGIWHNPGFEARYDCIWDGADPPISAEDAQANNDAASEFIESEREKHGAFILTAPPITGWSHKQAVTGRSQK